MGRRLFKQMALKLSTSTICGAVLCIIATLLYLDMYASDPLINSPISRSPVSYIYQTTSKNRYRPPIQSQKLHRNLLLQIDEAKDYSKFLSTENTTRKYLKQPRRKPDVKQNNSSYKMKSQQQPRRNLDLKQNNSSYKMKSQHQPMRKLDVEQNNSSYKKKSHEQPRRKLDVEQNNSSYKMKSHEQPRRKLDVEQNNSSYKVTLHEQPRRKLDVKQNNSSYKVTSHEQPKRILDEKQNNSTYKIESKNTSNVINHKVIHVVKNFTSNEEFEFDYEYTYDYASESLSSQGHSNGNSWLYRIAPVNEVKHERKSGDLKRQKQTDYSKDWTALEKIAENTAEEGKHQETQDKTKYMNSEKKVNTLSNNKHTSAETSKYTNSQKIGISNPGQRTSNHGNIVQTKIGQSDNLMEKVLMFMNAKNISESKSKQTQPRKSQDMVKDSKNFALKLTNLPNLNLTDIKERYRRANRTDIPEELYRLAPEVFDQFPPSKSSFSAEFKSPCWYRGTNVHCLPYFYLAGMPKCGTTDMWAKINSHNGVYGTRKEPHWWARQRILTTGLKGNLVKNDTMTFNEYVDRYSLKEDSKRWHLPETDIAGDGSVSTFWDNYAWETFYPEFYHDGPPYVTGDIIHAITPGVKVILLLRNPIDRLYSSYRYFYKQKQPSPSKFQALVNDGIWNYKQCLQKRSFRACVYSLSSDFKKDKLGLTRGIYGVFIQDWLKSFSKHQIMIIRLEDWSKNCNTILPQIFQFLGLDPLRPSSISTLCSLKRARNQSPTTGGKMLTKTRIQLSKFYKPHLLYLAEMMGDGKFLW